MADCDERIAEHMEVLEDCGEGPAPPTNKKGARKAEEPMRQQLFENFGVDLTAVEGVRIQTALTFLSEVGSDVSKFPSADHFASWLGLCPDNRITGGRTHAAHTRPAAAGSTTGWGHRPAHGRAIPAPVEVRIG